MPLVQSRPGSSLGRSNATSPVRASLFGHSYHPDQQSTKRTTPLPYFGIDRMGDFGQAGPANMWKSDLIFSTGISEAELRGQGAPVEPAATGDVNERTPSRK